MSRPTHARVGQSCVYHLSIRHALSSAGAVLDAEKTNHSKKYSFSKNPEYSFKKIIHFLKEAVSAMATPLSNTLFVIPDGGERRQLQYCQMSPPTSPKSAIFLFSFLKKYFSVFVLLPIMSDVTFSVSPRLPFQPSTNQSL